MTADHAPSEMEEAMEAARRIVERYRHYPVVRHSEANYDTPISDSNIVARAFLALSRKAEEERERCAKVADSVAKAELVPRAWKMAADEVADRIRSLPALIEEGE